jgi:hypothetical protein
MKRLDNIPSTGIVIYANAEVLFPTNKQQLLNVNRHILFSVIHTPQPLAETPHSHWQKPNCSSATGSTPINAAERNSI